MGIKKRRICRQIGGETFLVPVGTTVYDSNGLFFLTEVGAFLWERLPQAQDAEQLLSAVLEEYEVDEATARADIAGFLDKLKAMEIV